MKPIHAYTIFSANDMGCRDRKWSHKRPATDGLNGSPLFRNSGDVPVRAPRLEDTQLGNSGFLLGLGHGSREAHPRICPSRHSVLRMTSAIRNDGGMLFAQHELESGFQRYMKWFFAPLDYSWNQSHRIALRNGHFSWISRAQWLCSRQRHSPLCCRWHPRHHSYGNEQRYGHGWH